MNVNAKPAARVCEPICWWRPGPRFLSFGSLQSGTQISNLSRVLQGIVQGVGFRGAGAIIIRTGQQKTQGLTTAANIWATAGIGVVVGPGLEATAVLSTVIVLIILAVVPLHRAAG
jgi:putative Mg2+ transporter-C (MgtC) family protein